MVLTQKVPSKMTICPKGVRQFVATPDEQRCNYLIFNTNILGMRIASPFSITVRCVDVGAGFHCDGSFQICPRTGDLTVVAAAFLQSTGDFDGIFPSRPALPP